MSDRVQDDDSAGAWQADFAAAEERRLDASLSVTPAERLKWLEEALEFAVKVGALPEKER